MISNVALVSHWERLVFRRVYTVYGLKVVRHAMQVPSSSAFMATVAVVGIPLVGAYFIVDAGASSPLSGTDDSESPPSKATACDVFAIT
jgi:hypothetical protein